MRIWHWVIAASLLLTLSANAQQSANSSSSPATAQTPASAAPPSTTMDQVVDRAVEREHALMEMLKARTPLVETYLQHLKFDPQVGPAPVQDHYFLGRMDLGEAWTAGTISPKTPALRATCWPASPSCLSSNTNPL